jgi:hypothetical protein
MIYSVSAFIYAVFMAIVVVFQFCLVIGMPWGAASMGGKFPGKYPPKMRIVAVINIAMLCFLTLIVLTRAGMILPQLFTMSKHAVWFVVAFSAISVVLNAITPSKIERIWVTVTVVHLTTSTIVAFQ